MEQSPESLIRLFSVPGIGGVRMRKLISFFGNVDAVLTASLRDLMEVEGVDKTLAENIKTRVDESFAKEQLKAVKEYQVRLLTYWDKEYPERLKSIYDPPPFLFTRGSFKVLKRPALAVVGTRNSTSYGRTIAERLAGELARKGLVIISGFARGIDTIAHKAALKCGGATSAVLGNGVDIIYPAANRELYGQMLEHGIFLSEYPMGTKPDAGNFPKRNRLISGISYGILVVEAAQKSGALLTAMYGLDQNREIFATPGSILSEKSRGTHRLIREGAKLVESVDDILDELRSQLSLEDDEISVMKKQPPKLNPDEQPIYALLSDEPMHIDQIAFKLNLSPGAALGSLLSMELMGLVRQMAGKMFVRI